MRAKQMGKFYLNRIYDDSKDDFQIAFMRKKAIYNIEELYKFIYNDENKIFVEIPFDLTFDENNEEWEYLWFSVLKIMGGEIVCRLIQNPLFVCDVYEGEIYRFDILEISNWIIERSGEIIFPFYQLN